MNHGNLDNQAGLVTSGGVGVGDGVVGTAVPSADATLISNVYQPMKPTSSSLGMPSAPSPFSNLSDNYFMKPSASSDIIGSAGGVNPAKDAVKQEPIFNPSLLKQSSLSHTALEGVSSSFPSGGMLDPIIPSAITSNTATNINETTSSNNSIPSLNLTRGNKPPSIFHGKGSFPLNLTLMLESVESMNLSHVVSWLPDGKSFVIHDPEEFLSEVLPKFFK